MSANLGTILVGLGYDLSALEKGAPEAFRLVNSQTLGMSAEMKRASREGAESLRLIDEALGIHLSRPLTRLLTQEFPALATGLQSILGVGAFGAISVAGIEFFDKISKSIEHAQKAEEEFANGSRKTQETFDESMASYAKSDKLRSLSGIDKKLFEIDFSSVEEARHKIDALAESMEKEAKASQEAAQWSTKMLAAIGEGLHVISNSPSTLGIEATAKQLEEFKRRFDDLSRMDALKGTHESAKALTEELAKAQQALVAMTAMRLTPMENFQRTVAPALGATPVIGFSDKEIAAQKQYLENLQKIKTLLDAGTKDQAGKDVEAVAEAAAEAAKKAQSAIQQLYKEMGNSLAKLQPETDPLKELANKIRLMKQTAESDFRAMGESAASALSMRAALDAVDTWEKRLDQVLAKAKADADLAKATAELPTKLSVPTTMPNFPQAPPVAPQLGAGGTAGAQVSAFAADQNAQLKMAAQAYQDAMTPLDKYNVAIAELKILLNDGKISQAAFTAAQQHADDVMEQADKKIEHAKDGLRSFFAETQQESNTGRFTFDILSQGMKGFEDQVADSLTNGKTEWQKYFLSLDQMALKFTLNKEMSGFFKDFSSTSIGKSLMGLVQSPAQQAAATQTNIGSDSGSNGFSPFAAGKSLMSSFQGGASQTTAATTQLDAGTLMQTAANNQLAAAQMMASSTNGGGVGGVPSGGDGSSSSSFLDLSDSGSYGEYASGSDYTPGGAALVGEDGPEMVNLPTGSSVTPNSAMRSGSPNINFHIDAKGSEIGVEEKIARALSASAPQMIMRAVVEANEVQKRSLQRG